MLSDSSSKNSGRKCFEYTGNMTQIINEINCSLHVKYELSNLLGEYCTCYWLCDDYIYYKIISTADWPKRDVLGNFIETYINKGLSTSAQRTFDFLQRVFPINNSDVMDGDEYDVYYVTKDGNIKEIHVPEDDREFLEELAELCGNYTPNLTFPLNVAENWKETSFFRLVTLLCAFTYPMNIGSFTESSGKR